MQINFPKIWKGDGAQYTLYEVPFYWGGSSVTHIDTESVIQTLKV